MTKPATGKNKGTPAAKPQGGTPPSPGVPPASCNVVFKDKGWTLATYTNEDDSSGFMLTNGQTAFHFDSSGNMILATGKPLGGCGGKAIISSSEFLQKTGSVAIEVSGNDEKETSKKDNKGNSTKEKTPAYSLAVFGDIAIEAIGGEVGIKGDNVSIKANNNLILEAGEAVKISSGSGAGNLNIFTGNLNLTAMNFNKKITGGEYSKGSGEFKVEQTKPGAVTEISTPGSINYIVNGNYTVGVTGDYNLNIAGACSIAGKKNYFLSTKGNYVEEIEGKKTVKIKGIDPYKTQQKETYLLDVGSPSDGGTVSMQTKANADIKTSTVGQIEIESTKKMVISSKSTAEFKAVENMTIKGKQIYLN
jgi:hypothetical protein